MNVGTNHQATINTTIVAYLPGIDIIWAYQRPHSFHDGREHSSSKAYSDLTGRTPNQAAKKFKAWSHTHSTESLAISLEILLRGFVRNVYICFM